MERNKLKIGLSIFLFTSIISACSSTKKITEDTPLPANGKGLEKYTSNTDSSQTVNWRSYFTDPNLVSLIDSALVNNQELNSILQEIAMIKNEVRGLKSEYLPNAGIRLGAGTEKVGEFTRNGAVEHQLEIEHGKEFPEPFSDFSVNAYFSWEVDIWGKFRNAKKAALTRYLSTNEGRNFVMTEIVAEIANSYYELLALDNQLEILNQYIKIQEDVLKVVIQQKDAARVSQLAVNRFEAQVLNTKNRTYEVKQNIVETENRINYLVGRAPQRITRNINNFEFNSGDSFSKNLPANLLINRPDIRKAEKEIAASKLDVKSARANFYPSLRLDANLGFNAYNPKVWFNPASLIYDLFGDIVAPLINRNAIRANYLNANAKQKQAILNYQQTILKAAMEVENQFAGIDNYKKSYETKAAEVDLLNNSVVISSSLFTSARADYMEVLLTQREALDALIELNEVKLKKIQSNINLYKAFGGGWSK